MKVLGRFFIYGMLLLCAFAGAREIPGKVIQAGRAIYKFDTPRNYATGFFIKPNIFVVNFHTVDNIKNLNEISLQKINHSSIKIKKLLAVSAYADLAVLRTNRRSETYLLEGPSPESNEALFILGHLNDNDELKLMRKTGSLKLWSDLYYEIPVDFSEDADGMSGSPLLDSQGRFVGVVARHTGNVSSSITSYHLKKLLSGRIGTVCRKKARDCIEKELQVVQNHVGNYLINNKFTSDMTFFHADLKSMVQYTEDIELYLLKGARQGNADAQYYLAEMYDKGEGVEQDDEQASYWYKKAAEQGDASAQYNLGVRYDKGEGVEQDDEQASYWYKKAAEQGNASAQYNLGVRYDKGEGVEQDDEQASYWYKKAAEQGNASAQYNLAIQYFEGNGVEESLERTVYWFKKSAEQGDEDAKNALDTLRSRGYID